MNKKSLSETDICDRYISPALVRSGWDETRWRREYFFTAGRIIVRGQLVARGKKKKADYLLFYKPNIPIAIIEAKNNSFNLGAGMQQGLGYADTLDIPFVFSSNGDGFLFHDKTGNAPQIETKLALDEFPSPQELWERYKAWKGLSGINEELVTSPSFQYLSDEQPRYYQQLAVNRTIEAIARGQKRILLTMATGTGKTRTAFNIIWRLWKTRKAKRILFLADRNILIDQTMINDFRPFGSVMTKLNRSLVDKESGTVDTSYEIYLALYQAIIGGEDSEPIFDKFPRDFFDVVVVDECHRGSAADDATWKSILKYFDSAIQIGMTATPRETKYVSNISYFGEPVYSYSLRQGIDDGFLAPFKVIRVDMDLDLQGWRPESGMVDDQGNLIVDRTYNQSDINKEIIFPEPDKLVARKISEFLHNSDPMNKTIVFCSNIDHAERMRQALVNEPLNAGLVASDHRYVMRITGDNDEGKNELDNFIDPKRPYPVIATTSKLMSTGVDAQTCKLIVLDQKIQSMTEFKQIIGRGTRLRPDYGKFFFTIIDFKKATELFADPDWDGPAISIKEIDQDGNESVVAPDPLSVNENAEIDEVIFDPSDLSDLETDATTKFVVSGVAAHIVSERVQYYDKDGKLITESLRDFTRKAVGQEFKSLDQFIKRWNETERKQAIVEELLEKGVILEALEESVGRDLDPFDLICHIAFDKPPLTRRQRADGVKKQDVFSMYGAKAREVLDILLDKYADQGLETIEKIDVLKLDPFSAIGTPIELVKAFGGRDLYLAAVQKLQSALYATSA